MTCFCCQDRLKVCAYCHITRLACQSMGEHTMQGYGDNFILVIPEDESEMFHTQGSPFCPFDPTCPCHEDPELIAEVAQFVANGELTPQEATDFVAGGML